MFVLLLIGNITHFLHFFNLLKNKQQQQKKQNNIKGMTGPIKFDQFGSRSNFKLLLFELTREGLKHVSNCFLKVLLNFPRM